MCKNLSQNIKSQRGRVLQLRPKICLLKYHLIMKNESIAVEVKKQNELWPCVRFEFAHGGKDSALRGDILPPTSGYKIRRVVSSENTTRRHNPKTKISVVASFLYCTIQGSKCLFRPRRTFEIGTG
jgi:hypothetical protein